MEDLSIRIEGLAKHFGKRAIFRDVSFKHSAGILGLAGSNGSGKSTLLKCMAGLWRPSKGKVRWQMNGRQTSYEHVKKLLGYVAPYINLYHELTCYENLHFLLKLRNRCAKEEKIRKVLQLTFMEELYEQAFQNLSTGQQQRMKIAAALVHQPSVLFLDEAGSNLDKAGREMVRSIVEEFKSAGKLTVIASNNENELKLCDRIYSIEKEAFDEA